MSIDQDCAKRGLSAHLQTMVDRGGNEGLKLLYMWVKQGVVSQNDFIALTCSYMAVIAEQATREVLHGTQQNNTKG